VVLQGGETFRIEATNAPAHRLGTHPKRLGNAGRRLAPTGTPDDAGALDPARRRRPRAGQALDREGLFGGHPAQANKRTTHGTSPAQEKPPAYLTTCRMIH